MDRALKEAQHYSHFDALKVPLKVYRHWNIITVYSDWNSIFNTGTVDTVYKLYYFGSGVLQKIMNTLSYYTIKKLATNRHVSGSTAKSATYITFLGHSNSMSRQASHITVYLAWFHSGIMLSQQTFQRCQQLWQKLDHKVVIINRDIETSNRGTATSFTTVCQPELPI